jgi:hypothetical protein
MDLHAWFVVLRLPIEIVAACLAVLPALLLLRAWNSLPDEIPVHFGFSGRPHNSASRYQAWIIPCVALVIYGAFSTAGGTWGWMLGGRTEVPRGLEPLLLIRMFVDLLMSYITWGSIRVARKEAEGQNTPVLFGLLLLSVAPGVLLAIAKH